MSGGCQKCGEIARKVDQLYVVEHAGKFFLVCKFCADTDWWRS